MVRGGEGEEGYGVGVEVVEEGAVGLVAVRVEPRREVSEREGRERKVKTDPASVTITSKRGRVSLGLLGRLVVGAEIEVEVEGRGAERCAPIVVMVEVLRLVSSCEVGLDDGGSLLDLVGDSGATGASTKVAEDGALLLRSGVLTPAPSSALS